MQKNKYAGIFLFIILIFSLAACGSNQEEVDGESSNENEESTETTEATGQTEEQKESVQYLGEEYTVPAEVEDIAITGSMESMEDALVLGVEPAAGITTGGTFPEMFSDITGSTVSSGEKQQPDMEGLLELEPDVILSSTKFPEEVQDNLNKITTTIPISHISADWKENLQLLASLTGKQDEADKILEDYEEGVAKVKDEISDSLENQTVVTARIRGGDIMVYPEDIFFNSSLYSDLGLKVPEQIKNAETQEVISLEKFSEMNPDYIFVQFAETENADQPEALDDLEDNPIWNSMNAVQHDRVFVNVVDPVAQGGTAWSKMKFLEAAEEKLSNQ
ncbi:iron complex transport system substrate-binding protein [Salibacterium salarium]|uniref:ABC transporter substrate-binding protein n=1 Tax=Salibacterium salarium TaxID=284579 RepID=UPI00277E1E5C|nr:ABC transporter substrate-binding protein [Salibacterium salarium]MDQ0297933.1 iron complex transport system substrate-binding protein [Salibacterium salarium]